MQEEPLDLPDGWSLYSTHGNPATGFAASVYRKDLGGENNYEYVMSFRGTDETFLEMFNPLDNNDWYQNLQHTLLTAWIHKFLVQFLQSNGC